MTRSDTLIDVSDLDASLPRVGLQQYTFTDEDFDICVIVPLEEAVPKDRVRVGELQAKVMPSD